MSVFLLNLLLALAWAALTGRFEPDNLLFGFFLSYFILWLVTRMIQPQAYFLKLPRIVEFSLFFLKEMALANFRMAVTVLSPRMQLRPAVVGVPLELQSEAGLVILMNLITLTPGTLSLDLSSDRKMIYIHTIWLNDADSFRAEIKQGYERRIKEIIET